MPEPKNITYSYKELAEVLVRHRGIHEGLWGIYIEFGIAAANVGDSKGDVLPTAIVPVQKIGIQRFSKPSNLTIDASQVNPEGKSKKS